jgi:uncharacterized protein YfaS (alpha-2-macroglobulin family)
LLLAFPTVAQEDEHEEEEDDKRPFFSLSTNRTWSSTEKPQLQLWGSGINKLQFRLYRVNDPVKFFEQLEDAHQFGGQAPRRTPKRLTTLERFHLWKLRQRARLRDGIRAQFTADSRGTIREWRTGAAAKPAATPGAAKPAVTEFAAVPVLNQEQLVATWVQPFQPKNRWDSATVDIPTRGKGVYLVEATDGKLQAYTIAIVTDIAIVTKGGPGRLMARVLQRDNGAPVNQAQFLAYTGTNRKRILEKTTGGDGFIDVQVNEADPEELMILARKGEDFAAAALYGSSFSNDEARKLTGYIYTDRPVYRPGHTVHYRAVFRYREALGFRVPEGREFELQVDDAEGNAIHRKSLRASDLGTMNGSFELPSGAPLGTYSLVFRSGESYDSGTFIVEEYKKPEYQVRVNADTRRVVQGARVGATLEARYFYGEPVANAKVTWVVHKSRYWLPYYDDFDDEGGGDRDSAYEQREQVSEESGTLDPEGKLRITVPTAAAEHDQRYRIEARVTDEAGREIAGASFVIATVGPYFIRIDPEEYVYEPGARAAFLIETRDYDNNPVPNAPYHVELREYRWRQPDGAALATADGRTDAQGKARVEMNVRSGSLVARAVSRTPQGRDVTDSAYVWVSGGSSWYSSAQRQRLEIVPDKKSYKAGDTARLLVVAGQPGSHLWITVEGRAVHQSHFMTSKEGTVTIEVPIRKEYAPNFFVSAVTLRGNEMVYGTRIIKVPPEEYTLKVDLKPSKEEFKPGEPASYLLEARDYAGKPVRGEFSLGVVDEAIYSVRPESVQEIDRFFFGRDWNRISTDNSLHYYFNGEAGKRRMQLARVRPWNAHGQLKPDNLVQPKVRKAFPDTAYWSPAVMTDASGRARVQLEFPDALTTWRATARGITADTKVGSAINRVIVRKNLLIRLSTPRFFRLGDEMVVTAIAQNFLPREKQVRVSLEAKGLDVLDGATRDIRVPTKGTGTVDFRVKVPAAREAVLLVKALTDEESDAMELTLPVVPYGVKLSESRAGSLHAGSTQADADLTFPSGIEPSSRTIEITASPSVAGAIFDALEFLTSFPYGCTEQTMSSFLPNVVVSKAASELKLKSRINEAELKRKISAGMERLVDFQHEDGGWGWWKTDDSDVFMTAYVLAGLNQATEAGHEFSKGMLDKAAAWLIKDLARHRDYPQDLRAYSAYALALNGHKEPAFWTDMFNQRSRMTPYGLALLGLGLDRIGDSRARQVADELERSAQSNEREAWWQVSEDSLMRIAIETTPEATAYAVKLLSKFNPQSPLLPKAAVWLVGHRNNGYYWNSTKQTAMVIYGLTDYLKQSGELNPDYSFSVSVNGKSVMERRFTEADARALTPVTLKLTADQLASGQNRIRVSRSGEGRLYWSARAEYYSTSGAMTPRGDVALSLQREYFRLVPTDTGGRIVHRLQPLSGPVSQGDVLAVRLKLGGGDWRYLLIEDPLPAGAEAVERDDLYTIAEKPPWWRYWFTRRELRDDRVAFFQTWFDRETEYFYLMKVVNPGKFRISPARAEPMYQPDFLATSDPANLEVIR